MGIYSLWGEQERDKPRATPLKLTTPAPSAMFSSMRLLPPVRLNEDSFEPLIRQLALVGEEEEVVLDLSPLEFIDPYGMVGLLELGEYFASQNLSPLLIPPASEEVLKYLERLDFLKLALEVYRLAGLSPSISKRFRRKRASDVLLEITKIERSLDIHEIVTRVKIRAKRILKKHLNYNSEDIDKFLVAISEVCQNIPEHSKSTGWVGVQKYFYEKRLSKNVVKIAVMDLGIGMKKSLGRRRWSDEVAIRKALFEGVSRHKEVGRGHGLVRVRGLVEAWGGKLAIRSGTAKAGVFPAWDSEKVRRPLPNFPGTQISIVLPQLPS